MGLPKGYKFSAETIEKRSSSIVMNGKRRKKPSEDGMFVCPTCKTAKPREMFHKDKRTWSGLKSQCRECHSKSSVATRNMDNYRKSKRKSEAIRRARKAMCDCSITAEQFDALEAMYGSRCLCCGSTEDLQWDHIVPLAHGGPHSVSNLQRLCRVCNEKKQARFADYRSEEQKVWVVEFRKV